MSGPSPTTSQPASRDGATDAPPRGPFAMLIETAGRATSRDGFYRQALRAIASACDSPYAALYARLGAQIVEDDCHYGPTDPSFWKSRVRQFLTDSLSEHRTHARLLSARGSDLRLSMIAVPLFTARGAHIGSMALVAPVTEHDARQRVAFVESLAALTSYLADHLGASGGASAAPRAPNQALARAATVDTVEELAFSITNNLRNKLACEQVALGLVHRNRVRVISLSGLDDVKHRSPGVASIRAAMEECLDVGAPIASSRDGGWSGNGQAAAYRLHEQWRKAADGAAIATIPLTAGDRIAALISLRRRAEEPFTPEQIEQIKTAVEPYAAALMLVQRAGRGIGRHIVDRIAGAGSILRAPGGTGRKFAAGFALALAVWFAFGSINYDVTIPCSVTAKSLRHIATPFDGVLAETLVIAGDRVRAGQVLCALDHRDLSLRREEILAMISVSRQQKLAAMAENAPVKVKLAEADERLHRARLDIVERRIEQAVIRSPIDGVVVKGDLRPQVGATLTQGASLFDVAPPEQWRLELKAPETLADDLVADLRGRFAGRARPEESQEFVITRVRPQSEALDGDNAFIVEARVDASAEWIRPGMEGFARVHVGRRRVWWVALHHIVDYIRLNLWL